MVNQTAKVKQTSVFSKTRNRLFSRGAVRFAIPGGIDIPREFGAFQRYWIKMSCGIY